MFSSRVAVFLLAGTAAGCGGRDPVRPNGSWIGDVTRSGAGGPDRLEITIDSAARSATVTLRSFGVRGDTAARATGGADTVGFAIAHGGDTIGIRGVMLGANWEGTVTGRNDTARFHARRLEPWTDANWRSIVGGYRSADSGLVTVAPFSEFGDRPMLVDHRSGRIAALYPVSRTRVLLGASLIAPVFPADSADLTIGPDGTVEALRVSVGRGSTTVARRIAIHDEEVKFANDSVTLAGTLLLPEGAPPYPALVLVHGSNALTRDVFGPWARFFAAHGFAVLTFDKRGTGASTGDWQKADFLALAGDVAAGVRFLGTRSDIRRDRIGLWGASQAGWIMPVVAAGSPKEIAFMVVHAGTGTTVREQGILNLRNELRFGGLPDSSVALGVRYRLLDDQVTESGRGWDGLQRFYDEHRAANPWLWPPDPPDVWFRPYYRMLMPFDPTPYWRRVSCPVLLFFGELDANVPPTESWPPIERALVAGGNRNVTHVLLPKANHLFLEARTGGREEYPGLSRFVPGYFDRMAAWLSEQGTARP